MYAEYGRQASGATDNTKDTNAQEKTIFTGVNVDSIYSGVFDVNNILIHVAQNFVNIINLVFVFFVSIKQDKNVVGRTEKTKSILVLVSLW